MDAGEGVGSAFLEHGGGDSGVRVLAGLTGGEQVYELGLDVLEASETPAGFGDLADEEVLVEAVRLEFFSIVRMEGVEFGLTLMREDGVDGVKPVGGGVAAGGGLSLRRLRAGG